MSFQAQSKVYLNSNSIVDTSDALVPRIKIVAGLVKETEASSSVVCSASNYKFWSIVQGRPNGV